MASMRAHLSGDSTVSQVVCGSTRLCIAWPTDSVQPGDLSAENGEAPLWSSRVTPKQLIGTKQKVVFFIHGRGGSKEVLKNKAATLAARGMMVVYGDLPNHGERLLDPTRNEAWDKGNLTHASDMYSQMLASVDELREQLDLLPSLLGVTFAKVAVVGISQGGHAALLTMANESRVNVCVALIGGGDYRFNMEKRYERLVEAANGQSVPDFEELFPSALAATIRRIDPIENICRVALHSRPILMLNGGDDNLVPIAANERLVAKLKPLYDDNDAQENLSLVSYPGVGHKVTKEMMEKTLAWLEKHL